MTVKEQRRIEQAYKTVSLKNPGVSDPRVLEMLTRKYLRRKKLLRILVLFLMVLPCILIGNAMVRADATFVSLLGRMIWIAGPILLIVSVCMFAKYLHSPLTLNESKELEVRETLEKTGEVSEDLSQFDNRAFIEHEQQAYDRASPLGKLLRLFARIPILGYFFIAIFMILGITFAVDGIGNVIIYEQKRDAFVEVTAVISHFGTYTDSEGETSEIPYWKYTYDGTEYNHRGNHYNSSMEVGDTDTLLIDPTNPGYVLDDSGGIFALIGIACIFIGLYSLISSLNQARKRDVSLNGFGYFWMLFALGALAFAGVGIYTLLVGDLTGILVFIGAPIFAGAAWLFYKYLYI